MSTSTRAALPWPCAMPAGSATESATRNDSSRRRRALPVMGRLVYSPAVAPLEAARAPKGRIAMRLVIPLVLIGSIGVAAFFGDATAQAPGPIKIGFLAPLSGAIAQAG